MCCGTIPQSVPNVGKAFARVALSSWLFSTLQSSTDSAAP